MQCVCVCDVHNAASRVELSAIRGELQERVRGDGGGASREMEEKISRLQVPALVLHRNMRSNLLLVFLRQPLGAAADVTTVCT